ncbi:hypothetical protein GCM10028778_23970 [Barrientosiimonas marina]|uniref:Lysozyme family protein n=1 Tax=Lentibacillus kimchii TaxID=1542911 RepID=A0ABW2UZB3_9BACI
MKRTLKRKMKRLVISALVLGGLAFLFVIMATDWQPDEINWNTTTVSNQVLDYQPLIRKYANKYGVAEHINVLMAMMMQESGGRGDDPMQSSESLCGSRGCIDDPEKSVQQGVHYFAEALDKADGDLKLAVQSYNFGQGFIDYVNAHSGTFTQEAAVDFSQEMYADADNQSNYRCSRRGTAKIEACYGDIYYARDVMTYTESVAKK